ncbi:hypothetical protein CSUNSWCD_596 [Campylobacter showae CSUNSWCD]|uniref:Uncharacterized protein n=1 Tax=Campylobacter showae CSUNSWCD TaxID=1244083 RepID=M5IIZ2_9BACT|nr:hypothetical protein CSUNSWCD_596 [Campylobacter showae CSUNSWCD]
MSRDLRVKFNRKFIRRACLFGSKFQTSNLDTNLSVINRKRQNLS